VPKEGTFRLFALRGVLDSFTLARIFDQRPPLVLFRQLAQYYRGGLWKKIRAHGEVVRRDAQKGACSPFWGEGGPAGPGPLFWAKSPKNGPGRNGTPPFSCQIVPKEGTFRLFALRGVLDSFTLARIFDQRPPRSKDSSTDASLDRGGLWSKIRAHGEVVRRDAQKGAFSPFRG
jgi:hypothetical protein